MQAIVVKYLAPTNTKPSRVKASCQAGSLTQSWDHALDCTANMRAAAEALCEKLGWVAPHYTRLVAGTLPDEREVFVFADKS